MEKAKGAREMDDSGDGWLKLQEISGWCEMEAGGRGIGGYIGRWGWMSRDDQNHEGDRLSWGWQDYV